MTEASSGWLPEPALEGSTERDDVPLGFQVHGDGEVTVLLMPTWSIVHSHVRKAQVGYLARHCRVLTLDGRRNGLSGRPAGAAAYANEEYAADTLAVMDATRRRGALLVTLSPRSRQGALPLRTAAAPLRADVPRPAPARPVRAPGAASTTRRPRTPTPWPRR